VPEELLDVAGVGAPLKKMGRAAVAQRVGRDPDVEAGRLRVRADEVLDALDVEVGPPVRDEERPLPRILHDLGPAFP
jgi:hypothetical protein